MEQLPLVQDVTPRHLIAAKLDVKAAGGFKVVGRLVYPDDKDPENAQKKLSNVLNGNPGCKPLTYEQFEIIKDAACLKAGRSHLVEYEMKKRPVKIKWVPRKVLVQRAESRLADLLQAVQDEVAEIKKWS